MKSDTVFAVFGFALLVGGILVPSGTISLIGCGMLLMATIVNSKGRSK